MADLPPSGRRNSTESDEKDCPESEARLSKAAQIECAICLQNCVNPTLVPCGHIFCFLCIKDIFETDDNSRAKCAICRRRIPWWYLRYPFLVGSIPTLSPAVEEDAFFWFYRGSHGWWLYDQRANAELEAAFVAGESKVELLIAGYVYLVDLHGMMQYRKDEPNKRRAVKRDKLGTLQCIKGVAGISRMLLKEGEERGVESDASDDSWTSDGSYEDFDRQWTTSSSSEDENPS